MKKGGNDQRSAADLLPERWLRLDYRDEIPFAIV